MFYCLVHTCSSVAIYYFNSMLNSSHLLLTFNFQMLNIYKVTNFIIFFWKNYGNAVRFLPESSSVDFFWNFSATSTICLINELNSTKRVFCCKSTISCNLLLLISSVHHLPFCFPAVRSFRVRIFIISCILHIPNSKCDEWQPYSLVENQQSYLAR
jgi:hypothetical protein